jgi:excisionase family DNA binding protein
VKARLRQGKGGCSAPQPTGSEPRPHNHSDKAAQSQEQPALHSIQAVALRLDVSEKSVRRYIKRGLLRAYKIGGQIRIADEDLMALLASCRLHKSDIEVE